MRPPNRDQTTLGVRRERQWTNRAQGQRSQAPINVQRCPLKGALGDDATRNTCFQALPIKRARERERYVNN